MSDNSENEEDRTEFPEEYWWWEGKDLYAFFATVGKHGYDNVYIGINFVEGDDGEQQAWISVVDKETKEVLGHYYQSHTCPPECCNDC